MKKQERRDLQILMQKYETELKNLGVDIKSIEQNLSRTNERRFPSNNGFLHLVDAIFNLFYST